MSYNIFAATPSSSSKSNSEMYSSLAPPSFSKSTIFNAPLSPNKCDAVALISNVDEGAERVTLDNFRSISVSRSINSLSLYTPEKKPGSDSKLVHDFELILKDAHFTDVTFVVKGKDIRAHKAILAGRSSVFKTMFTTNTQESKTNTFTIDDVEQETFEDMLLYIYTEKTKNLNRSAFELLPVADQFRLDELKSMCEDVLIDNLTIGNVSLLLIRADVHNAKELKATCLRFIREHRLEFRNFRNTGLYSSVKENRPELMDDLLDIFFD